MDTKTSELVLKRSMLQGARIRFSPTGASVRNQAIEKIIEQNLASSESTKGSTLTEIQDLVCFGREKGILRALDVRQGIESLERSRRIIRIDGEEEPHYKLSDESSQELATVLEESENRINSVVNTLFGSASGGDIQYRQPFLELLCLVFSRLSKNYVQVIPSQLAPGEFAEHHSLIAAIEEILGDNPELDREAFQFGINVFFRDSSPGFDSIKWNMAQNFYVAQALGAANDLDILTSEIMKDSSLYCDTNILIAGLVPGIKHHNSFLELEKACRTLGIQLKATHITLEELKGVITAHYEQLKRVIEIIPEETKPKIFDFLLTSYLQAKADNPELTVETFFEPFQDPFERLTESFGLIREDDKWFDQSKNMPEIKRAAESLLDLYFRLRHRRKYYFAGIHDALLLKWVEKKNEQNEKAWLLTLDMTLIEWNSNNTEKVKVITLDALLQWMPPVLSDSSNEERLAEIFSEAIRYQLLPRDTFFQLRDFSVFADMEIETQNLPAEDVEACIREIRQKVPQHDPSKASDREKIGNLIQKHFADPGTKFNRTLQELQSQITDLSGRVDDEVSNRKGVEEKYAEYRLKISLWLRLALVFVLFIGVESLAVFLTWKYGEGNNLFQKVTKGWVWPTLGLGIVAGLFPFILGRKRMRLLKFWKGDNK